MCSNLNPVPFLLLIRTDVLIIQSQKVNKYKTKLLFTKLMLFNSVLILQDKEDKDWK